MRQIRGLTTFIMAATGKTERDKRRQSRRRQRRRATTSPVPQLFAARQQVQRLAALSLVQQQLQLFVREAFPVLPQLLDYNCLALLFGETRHV